MAMNYLKLANQILANVGGKENIKYLAHCATRLRFNLINLEKVNTDELNNLPEVIKIVDNGNQFQIVIGPQVEKVFIELNALYGDAGEKNTAVQAIEKMSLMNRMLSTLAAIFTPYIGVLAGVGVVKGVVVLLQTLEWVSNNSYIFTVFNALASGVLVMLPTY